MNRFRSGRSIKGPHPSRRACVEHLEPRRLMSVTLEQGVLTITGTDGNDQILVAVVSRRLDQVAWRGRWRVLQRAGRARFCEVQVNGEQRRFKESKVVSVVVHAGAGDDSVLLGWNSEPHPPDPSFPPMPPILPLEADAMVHGGDGADVIVGGYGNDLLHGEAGDDRMYGLRGLDTVDGGDGNDTLGDACDDHSLSTMLGGPGDDILVGHHASSLFVPPDDSLAPHIGVPHSLFGGPGNDEFRAHAQEVRDVEPGESVSPAVCDRPV